MSTAVPVGAAAAPVRPGAHPEWSPARTMSPPVGSTNENEIHGPSRPIRSPHLMGKPTHEQRTRAWLYAVFFLLTMSQALPLTAIQVLLNRDLGLAQKPEVVNKYFAVEFSMSTLKPAYALLSDLLPIFGRKRVPYMVLGAVGYAVALQGYARVNNLTSLYAAGIISVIVFAICETGADGALVQLSRGDPQNTMKVQSTGMLVRSLGSFTATALSIPLLAVSDARTVISLSGVFAIFAAGAACAIPEPKTNEGNASNEIYDAQRLVSPEDVEGSANASSRRLEGGFVEWSTHSSHLQRALVPFKPCFTRRVATSALFLFAYRLPPTSLVTYTTFTFAQFTLPNWGYSGMLLLSMAGGILATWGYRYAAEMKGKGCPPHSSTTTTTTPFSWKNQFNQGLGLQSGFLVGAAVNAVSGLARLLVVAAWDGSREPSSAPIAELAISNIVVSGGLMFAYMPILALAARVAPRGLEAFGFSLMLFVSDLATTAGSSIAASLTKDLGLGSADDRSWNNLTAFIWMCAGFKFLPLMLLPVVQVEEESSGGRYEQHEDEDEEE